MKADTVKLAQIFGAHTRYRVPMFQRPYVWQKDKQWQPLWDDLREVAERQTDQNPSNDDFTHFLGAIVVDQEVKANGPSSRVVIDGQQRLTTLQLVIAAARALAVDHGDDPTIRKLEALLFLPDFLLDDAEDRLMLVPTHYDRAAFKAAIEMDGSPDQPISKTDSTHILTAYSFFRTSIAEWALDRSDGDEPAQKLRALAQALWDLLRLVVIALEHADDAQAIFETLNARGTPLLAADLVKNFLFRQIERAGDPNAAERAYKRHWARFDQRYWRAEVGQGRSRRPRIDVLLTHWLVLRTQSEISFQAVFEAFRRHAVQQDPLALLKDLDTTAAVYESFDEFDPFGIEGTFFHRLDVLETTTLMPVVLWIYGPGGITDSRGRRQALGAIESWLVRRMLCRMTTKNYNTIALSLLQRLSSQAVASGADVVDFLLSLDGESQRWPDDDAVLESVRTVPYYSSLTRRRLRMVLDAVEASMHGPKVGPYMDRDRLSIEHVLPQSWEQNWPLPIGVDPLEARIERDAAKHRIGNLALVTGALNGALSNAAWVTADGPSKRAELAKYSQYLINKEVMDQPTWDEGQIRKRGEAFGEAILRIWPRGKSDTPIGVLDSVGELSASPVEGHQDRAEFIGSSAEPIQVADAQDPVVWRNKSERMRALFAEGATVAQVSKLMAVDYAFAYGVAQRAGYVDTAAGRGSTNTREASAEKEQTEWSWDAYRTDLRVPMVRLEIAQRLLADLEAAVAERELPWQTQFRKGYVAIQRPGGYNVAVVDVHWRGAPRLAFKLPAPPTELGLDNPYPGLRNGWSTENEWEWPAITADTLPDVRIALDLIRPYHPPAGAMVKPDGMSSG